MHQAEAAREHGFEADRAVRGFGERMPLHLDVLGIVVRHDDVDRAVRDRVDDGAAVVLVAERRGELHEGTVLGDVELVQRQMGDRGRRGHVEPFGLGCPEGRDRMGAAHQGGVVAAARQADEAQVALQWDELGLPRDARKAEAARRLALVHHATADEFRILRLVHDEGAEIAPVGEGAAHHPGARERGAAVGEGNRAGFLEEADLGRLAAGEALRQRRHRQHADTRRVAGAAQQEVDEGGVVDDRIGVRLDHDRGDAAGRRREARARQRLAVFVARLAGVDEHVDEARRGDEPTGLDDLGPVRNRGRRSGIGGGDAAVLDHHVARAVDAAGGIDDAGVPDDDRPDFAHRIFLDVARALRRRADFSGIRKVRGERLEHRHAHGDAHLDLLADEAARPVGDRGVDLDAAVHRAGCMTRASGAA